MSSLWGDLSNLRTIRTPKTILLEQAEILNQATTGVIRAEVSTTQSGANLSHMLSIVAPLLGSYRFTVCVVLHDIDIYPCNLYDSQSHQQYNCPDEKALTEQLASILGGEKTRRIIESLLSQSRT